MIAALLLGAALAWQPSTTDLVALKRAALGGNFPIHVIAKKPSEMPRYDRVVFYPGPADPRWIWENADMRSSPEYLRYRNRALVLAAMAFGAAGDRWKTYYDDLTTEDEAQSASAPDPYRARHAFLDDMDAKLAVLAPPVPASGVDATIDGQAAKISDQDLTLVTNGYLMAPIAAESADLPTGVLARYAGPRTAKKYVTYIVERSKVIDDYLFYTDRTMPGSDDAVTGAYFEAIVDSGAAGKELQASYAAAADKARFGLTMARAFDMQNDRLEKSGRDEVAWILRNVRPEMSREAAVALLRSHNLKLDEKPLVDVIEIPIHSSIVCRTSIPVMFSFRTSGRLANVLQQPPHTTCM